MLITRTKMTDKQLANVLYVIDVQIEQKQDSYTGVPCVADLINAKNALQSEPYIEKITALWLDGYFGNQWSMLVRINEAAMCDDDSLPDDHEQLPLTQIIDLEPTPPSLDEIGQAVKDGFTYCVYWEFIDSVPTEIWCPLLDFKKQVERGELSGNEFEFNFR